MKMTNLTNEERLIIEKRENALVAEAYPSIIRTIEIMNTGKKEILVNYIHYKPQDNKVMSVPLSLLTEAVQKPFWGELKRLKEK